MIRLTNNTKLNITLAQCEVADLPGLLDADAAPRVNRGQLVEKLDAINSARHCGGNRYKTVYGIDLGDVGCVADAQRLVTEGWLAGEERARRELQIEKFAHLAPQSVNRRRKRRIADEGCELRLDAAMQREWEVAWETREKRYVSSPNVVSIGCAFGGNGGVSHEQMFWNGAQMAVTCDLLEQAGWRVELRAFKANQMPGYVHLQEWLVKRADQPARYDMILALFGHAGVYRTYGWAGNMWTERRTPESMGQPFPHLIEPTCKLAADAGLTEPLSLVMPQAYSLGSATENITDALRKFAAPSAA